MTKTILASALALAFCSTAMATPPNGLILLLKQKKQTPCLNNKHLIRQIMLLLPLKMHIISALQN